LVPSESRWGTSADKLGEVPIDGVAGDGAGEAILGNETLGGAAGAVAFDEDKDEAAVADLVTRDDEDVGAGPIT